MYVAREDGQTLSNRESEVNLFGKKQIFDAIAIALLTAVGNKIIEHIYSKLKGKEEDKEDAKHPSKTVC